MLPPLLEHGTRRAARWHAHLAYKAEGGGDLESNLVLAAKIYHGDRADVATLEDSVRSDDGRNPLCELRAFA